MSSTYQPLDDLNFKKPHTLDEDQGPQYDDSPPPFTQTEPSNSAQGTSSLQEDLEDGTNQTPSHNDRDCDANRFTFCLMVGLSLFFVSMILFFADVGPTAHIFGILSLNISIYMIFVSGTISFGIESIVGQTKFIKGIACGLVFTFVFSVVCMICVFLLSERK
ncbi:unnamed protein product [Candida parapsilosis]|uniref:Uncharacterized protein n=1 Tax=Candida parapsilosis (strain CDC 317 / ATCC MYA-4646) TaxID=578454 RepID=A0AAJ8W7D9_CANPC